MVSPPRRPVRGEVWLVDLGEPVGHEQGGRRPAIVVSGDALNRGQGRLVTVVPVTSRHRGVPAHIPLERAMTGLDRPSVAMTDQHRVVSLDRLERRFGVVDADAMSAIATWLRIFLEL